MFGDDLGRRGLNSELDTEASGAVFKAQPIDRLPICFPDRPTVKFVFDTWSRGELP